jgi:hypothetical protein
MAVSTALFLSTELPILPSCGRITCMVTLRFLVHHSLLSNASPAAAE